MFDQLALLGNGLLSTFDPLNFSMILVGLTIGVLAGALPGITMLNAIVLVLPFTYLMGIVPSLLLMTSVYCGGVFGGSITGILFNIPGDPMNVPTTWEGYQLNKKGFVSKALGMAIMCSAIGGFLSAVIMTVASPPFAKVALSFSSSEYFAVVFLGLASVVVIGTRSIGSALISLFIGLFLATIGMDDIYGAARFTFGSRIMETGINFTTVLIGIFAIGEVLDQLSQKTRRGHRPASSQDHAAAPGGNLGAAQYDSARFGHRHGHRRDSRHRGHGRFLRQLRRGKAGFQTSGKIRHGGLGRTGRFRDFDQCLRRRRHDPPAHPGDSRKRRHGRDDGGLSPPWDPARSAALQQIPRSGLHHFRGHAGLQSDHDSGGSGHRQVLFGVDAGSRKHSFGVHHLLLPPRRLCPAQRHDRCLVHGHLRDRRISHAPLRSPFPPDDPGAHSGAAGGKIFPDHHDRLRQ